MFKRSVATLIALISCVVFALPALAVSPNIVISQVYGGGGATTGSPTYKNDFVELFNRSASSVTMTSWTVQYGSASGTGGWSTATISGTIPAGGYFLVQLGGGTLGGALPTPDATGGLNLAAGAGKVALVNTTGALSGACPSSASIVDMVGYGAANCSETSPVAVLNSTTAAFRNGGGCTDTDSNLADFTVATPLARNSATPVNLCGGPTNPSATGLASPAGGGVGSSTLLTVTVTPGGNPASTGIMVSANLTSIGESAAQAFYDDGTHGDVTAGDNVFSYSVASVSGSLGTKSLAVSVGDAQSRTATATIGYMIYDLSASIPIHAIQGSGAQSGMIGNVVQTSGIVTGVKSNGFFIQAPEAEYDSDPSTSEAIYVFTSSAPSAAAAVGNLVVVTGTVAEYSGTDPYSPPLTELGTPTVNLLTTGNALPAPVVLTAADLNPSGALNQLERFESMRATFDWTGGASLTVVAPTGGSLSSEANATVTSDGAFYAVLTGTARPFIEPGIETPTPLPLPGIPVFDGNPEKIRISTSTLGGMALNLVAGQTLTGIVGPLDYGFRQWSIDVEKTASVSVSPTITYRAIPDKSVGEFTVASFNTLRFFDDVGDGNGAVTLSNAAYLGRQAKLSLAVRNVLKMPDVIGFQEIEDKLLVLQTIAAKINADALAASGTNPGYVAYQYPGNDIGGINVGFLLRTDRHTYVSSELAPGSKAATYVNPTTHGNDLIFDRPPLVLRATMAGPGGSTSDVTFIDNHLRSMSGVDDQTDARVRVKRAAGAEWLATYINTLQLTENVVVLGDMNAYQFNDGYVDVMGTIVGAPTPADQVEQPSPDLVDPNLTNHVMSLPATTERYSYTFDGNAHVFDHVLSESKEAARFSRIAAGRMNADFPEILYSDFTRPEKVSDHDPMVAYFYVKALSVTASATGSTTVCAPGTVSLSATPTGGSTVYSSYQWYRDAGSIPGAISSTYDAAQSGTYTVTVTDSLGKTSAASSGVVVTVNPLPAKPTITPSGATTFCTGGSVTLTSSAGSVYLWSTGATTPSISVATSGSFWVQVTDGNGCSSAQSDTVAVTVTPIPGAPAASSNSPVCEGGTLQLSAGTVSGATYAWTGPNSFTSNQQLPTLAAVTLAAAGTYDVTVTVDGCTSSAGSTTVVINANPATPVITAPASVTSGATGQIASVTYHPDVTYFWGITNGSITGGHGTNQITFTAGASGSVTLTVVETSSAACPSAEASKSIPIVAGGKYSPISPCRLFDTRNTGGVDAASPILAAGETRTLAVGVKCSLPASAKSLSVNSTVTGQMVAGELLLYRGDLSTAPSTTSISFRAGITRANSGVLELAQDGTGTFKVFNNSSGTVHFILDVNGYFE